MAKYDHEENLRHRRNKLVEAALNFGRMSTVGRWLGEDGIFNIPSHNDRASMTNYFRGQMEMAAINLIGEMTAAPLPPEDA